MDISFGAAFLAGILAFFSPCVLPLIPGYISFVSGVSLEQAKAERFVAVRNVLLFVLGFSIVFVLLGATASFIGQFLLSNLRLLYRLGGVLLVVFGLHMLDVLKIGLLNKDLRVHATGFKVTPVLAVGLGIVFGLGWSPCIGPILAGILALASTQETIWQGMALLAVFSLGLGLPFVLSALLLKEFMQRWKVINSKAGVVKLVAGTLLILSGVYF